MDFSARITRIEPSATLSIGNQAASLEAEGIDVVDLSIGEPDFRTPSNIVEAAKASLDAGDHGYTPTNGIPALKEAIADYLGGLGLDYEPGEVIVTPGAKQALYETIQTLVDGGDEVVLLDPAWVSYEAMVKLAGASLERLDLSSYEFYLTPAISDLQTAVTDETTLLILNTPSNPSGAVYDDKALRAVRDLAVDHDVTVISDEIYREITFGESPTSIGTLDDMFSRTVTINGFSKAYAMTGWRLGYLAAPEEVVSQAGKLHSHSVSCASNPVQHAGIEALRGGDEAMKEMVQTFEARRDLLVDLLADRGIDVTPPGGAFYLMLPVEEDDTAWCERAIEEAHVATVPGGAFGTPGYARISYANNQDRIREGVERLDDAGLL